MAGHGRARVGRFGYSDLKEAAVSGAAALWELDGISGEPLDDAHGSAAQRAPGKGDGWPGFVGGVSSSGPIGRTAKQSEAERQQLRSLAVSEEAEVADADEALWKQVEQEASTGRLMTRFLLP